MGNERELLQAFATALAEALASREVEWVEWHVSQEQLLLDIRPQEAFLFSLRVVPGETAETCFMSNDLAGIFYVDVERTEELEKKTVDEIRLVCQTVLDLLDLDILAAVRFYSKDDWSQIAQVNEKTIVQAGHVAAAITAVNDNPEALAALAAEVPYMLPADDSFNALVCSEGDETGGTSSGESLRRVYIGQDEASVRQLQRLDQGIHTAEDMATKTAAIEDMAALLEIPRCCARAYIEHLTNEGEEPDELTWLQRFSSFAGEVTEDSLPRIYPRETNFMAAQSHKLAFFDYWPCSPTCEETIKRNRRLLTELYDPESRRVLEHVMETSYMTWADGGLLSFHVEGIDGTTLQTSDSKLSQWSGPALDGSRRFNVSRVPGGENVVVDLRSLQPTRRGWRWNDGERWRRVDGDKSGWFRQRPPIVVLFGDV